MDNEDFRPSRRAVLGRVRGTLRGCGGAGLCQGAGLPARRGRRPPDPHVQPADRRIDRHDLLRRRPLRAGSAAPRSATSCATGAQNKMMKYDPRNVDNLAATLAADGHRRALPDDLGLPHAADQPDAARAPPATPTTCAPWPPTSGSRAAASSRSRAPPSPATAAGSASTTARTSCTWTAARSGPGAADAALGSDYPPRSVYGTGALPPAAAP